MTIKDLAGLSKPLTRLIEVISKGVGAVSTPYLIRRTADARAYEIKVIANALNQVRDQNPIPVVYDSGKIEIWQKPEDNSLLLDVKPIDQSVASRLEYQERKRQSNIENVTTSAAIALSKEETVSDSPPTEDWITRFFSSAQDITSAEMQNLWGKILAGEIKKPGSYSLRTLDFVRNITKTEAQVFEKVGRFALICGGTAFVPAGEMGWINKKDIQPADLFLLAELGIIYPGELAMAFDFYHVPEQFILGDEYLLNIRGAEIQLKIPPSIWKFTGIGQELLPLVEKPFDEEYFEKIAGVFLAQKGRVALGKIVRRLPDGGFDFQIIREIEISKPKAEFNPSNTNENKAPEMPV